MPMPIEMDVQKGTFVLLVALETVAIALLGACNVGLDPILTVQAGRMYFVSFTSAAAAAHLP